MSRSAEARILEAFEDSWRPDARLTVSEWATEHRVLSAKSGAGQGRWDHAVTPYLVEPMDCMTVHHPATLVSMFGPSQYGKTDGLIGNTIGYRIHIAPTAIMVIQPTVDAAETYSRQKLDPMLESTTVLRGKVTERKSRDAGNTLRFKDFPAGMIVLVGANSPRGLRQTSAGLVIADDRDAFAQSAGKEGDPWGLARARQRSYEYLSSAKALAVSSPGDAPSPTLAMVNTSDWIGVWVEPCPLCNAPIELLRNVLKYESPKRAEDIGETLPCEIECPACKGRIAEKWQHPMLDKGFWRVDRERPDAKSYGFRLPGLCARFRAWGATAAAAAKAEITQNRETRKVVVNTMFGEEDAESNEAPAWEPLYDRREPYPVGVVPHGGLELVAGVDVQGNRLEVEVCAYGRKLRSWSVAVRVLTGDVQLDEVWAELTALLMADYPTAWGTIMPISCLAIDSGYLPKRVYGWARKFNPPFFGRPGAGGFVVARRPRTVMICKGTGRWERLLSMARKVDATEKARGLKVVLIDDPVAKFELYGWLKMDRGVGEEPPGWCHFPDGDVYDRDHFEQLTAEEQKTVNGKKRFVLPEHVRNERLDCRVLCRAAIAAIVGGRESDVDWKRIERRLGVEEYVSVVMPPSSAAVAPRAERTAAPPRAPMPTSVSATLQPPAGAPFRVRSNYLGGQRR